jgi:hypothetical protein
MYESIVKDIEEKIETLKKVRSLLSEETDSGNAPEVDVTQKKRVMSAAGRANIAAAQRKRWGKRA